MSFFRWILGLPFAAVVTAVLFAMMAGLIQQPLAPLPPAKEFPDLDITQPEPEPEPILSKRPPDLTDKQPPIEIPKTLPSGKPTNRVTTPKREPIDIDPKGGSGSFATPVIKYPPQYPENCRSKNAQGTVLVQFDVTPEGTVSNPRIVESANACFNRTVLRTVAKWKYPPAYRNGRPVMRYGLVEQFSFQLTE